jgi:hypothetical protein
VPLGGGGATVAKIRQQPVKIRPGESLHGHVSVAFAKWRNRIPVVVERRRAGIAQRGKPIRAQLVYGDRLAWHKLVSGRQLTDLRQRVTRLLLCGVPAGEPVDASRSAD